MSQMVEKFQFNLVHNVVSTQTGCAIELDGSWTLFEQSPSFHIYLEGVNPLTGENFKRRLCTFSASSQRFVAGNLYYHGRFRLVAEAELNGQDLGVCFQSEVVLKNPEARPHVYYKISQQDSFFYMCVESNCWKYSRDKIWLYFDGHWQPLRTPEDNRKRVSFYLAAGERPKIEVSDQSISLEERNDL